MQFQWQSTWAERKLLCEFYRGSSGLVLARMLQNIVGTAQYQELQSLCSEFQDMFQSKQECTTLTEHSIPTGSLIPVQQAPYRLPYTHRECVKKETEAMFLDRVIEPSTSDWASPIVLIEKKDGGIRFCMDYCILNVVHKNLLTDIIFPVKLYHLRL